MEPSETGGWYADRSTLPDTTYVWFLRGGGAVSGSNAGVFAFGRDTGAKAIVGGFRVVLALE